MPKLKVDTKTSLYDPIEVEIDGKTFKVKKITREILSQISELDKLTAEGDVDAAFRRLELLLGQSSKAKINKLGINDIIDITRFIIENAYNPKPIEKNLQRPGQEKLIS